MGTAIQTREFLTNRHQFGIVFFGGVVGKLREFCWYIMSLVLGGNSISCHENKITTTSKNNLNLNATFKTRIESIMFCLQSEYYLKNLLWEYTEKCLGGLTHMC